MVSVPTPLGTVLDTKDLELKVHVADYTIRTLNVPYHMIPYNLASLNSSSPLSILNARSFQ